MLKTFKIPLVLTALGLLVAFLFGGLPALITVAILGILEISLSFDNAVVNAKILGRMDAMWQRIFLTIGIVIAVFGMRLIFPLLVVAIAAGLNPLEAFQLAMQKPGEYATHLHEAHASIAAFGGVFLGMLFLDWLFEERDIHWLKPIEQALAKVGKLENVSVAFMCILLVIAATLLGHTEAVLMAGISGLIIYLAVNALDEWLSGAKGAISAGLGAFLYLELIDASFSFDGVIGAFAVTQNIFLIALGLGIGAMYVRGLTVYLVRKGTLSDYIYLEHGAHWAIGALAILLLLTIRFEIPEVVTGLIGVGFIALAFINSTTEKKNNVRIRNTSKSNAS